jgi:hypothetical protein
MSISALGSAAAGATASRPALFSGAGSGFGAQVAVAVGQGRGARGAHGHRTQETGTPDNPTEPTGAVSAPRGATPVHTLADDTRALVGDVFGALGADTPTAVTARQAVEAYRRTG